MKRFLPFLATAFILTGCFSFSTGFAQDKPRRVWVEPTVGLINLDSKFFTAPLGQRIFIGNGIARYDPNILPGLGWNNNKLTFIGINGGFGLNEKVAILLQATRFSSKNAELSEVDNFASLTGESSYLLSSIALGIQVSPFPDWINLSGGISFDASELSSTARQDVFGATGRLHQRVVTNASSFDLNFWGEIELLLRSKSILPRAGLVFRTRQVIGEIGVDDTFGSKSIEFKGNVLAVGIRVLIHKEQ